MIVQEELRDTLAERLETLDSEQIEAVLAFVELLLAVSQPAQ